jgi:hypothetical protein
MIGLVLTVLTLVLVLTGLHVGKGTIAVTIAQWLCGGFTVVALAFWVFTAVTSVRVINRTLRARLGREPDAGALRELVGRYRAASRGNSLNPIAQVSTLCFLAGLLVCVAGLFHFREWLTFGLQLLVVGFQTNSRAIQFPFALYLGSSSAVSREFHSRLVPVAFPERVIELLHRERRRYRDLEGAEHSFRRPEATDDEWKTAVRELMLIVPVIVLDARGATEQVQEELAMIEAMSLGHKTIMIAESAEPPTPAQAVRLDPDAAREMVRMIRRSGYIPTPPMPIESCATATPETPGP